MGAICGEGFRGTVQRKEDASGGISVINTEYREKWVSVLESVKYRGTEIERKSATSSPEEPRWLRWRVMLGCMVAEARPKQWLVPQGKTGSEDKMCRSLFLSKNLLRRYWGTLLMDAEVTSSDSVPKREHRQGKGKKNKALVVSIGSQRRSLCGLYCPGSPIVF